MCPLPNLQSIGLALVVGLVTGAGPAWYWTATYKDASWSASVQAQELAAARQLREATDLALAVEREQHVIVSRLEEQHHEAEQATSRLEAANRQLAAQRGGLRDPGRRPSGQCPVPATTGGAGEPAADTAGAALSAEASEFLLALAASADRAATYAATCYDWIHHLAGPDPLAAPPEGGS